MPRHIGWARVRRFALLGSESFDSYLHGIDSLSPQWNAQETDGSVLGAWNTAVAYPDTRNTVINSDFANWTGVAPNDEPDDWFVTDVGDATSNVTENPAGQCQIISDGTLVFLFSEALVVGEESTITIIITDVSLGGITITMGTGGASANFNTVDTHVFSGTTGSDKNLFIIGNGACNVTVDSITAQQTNILASSQYAAPGDNPLDGADTATTVGVSTGIPAMPFARRFDGATSFINIYSAELNSIFNPLAGTLIAVAKVANAGVWTDGNNRFIVNIEADTNNRILIKKNSPNNTLQFFSNFGGVQEIVNATSISFTGMFMVAYTWDTAVGVDKVEAFVNGISIGTSATLGVWVGNLDSTKTVVGAQTTTPTNVWSGDLTENPLLGTRALTPGEILDIYQRSGI